MISKGNKSMQEAGETLFMLNANDRVRDLCEAREDYRRTWQGVKEEMEELQTKVEELKSSNEKKAAEIEEKDALIASLEAQNAELQRRLQNF